MNALNLLAVSAILTVGQPKDTGLDLMSWVDEPVKPIAAPAAPAAEPKRIANYRRIVLIPPTCGNDDGTYDVVVHFHGVHTAVEPAYKKSGLNAVLAIVNLGEFSGPYEERFAVTGSLTRLLSGIDRTVSQHCEGRAMGRVALSSWSGGYGATFRILTRSKEAARVDAVLLADGLHAGFTDKRTRSLDPLKMAPFVRFAGAASSGNKLMAMTHTEITTTYASSSETADYLLNAAGVERKPVWLEGIRDGMNLTSYGSRQGLKVYGFAGNSRQAHCDHLHAIGDTLFPVLKEHWGKTSGTCG